MSSNSLMNSSRRHGCALSLHLSRGAWVLGLGIVFAAGASCGDPTAARAVGAPASITIVGGDEQTGVVGELLPGELVVAVRDSAQEGVPDVAVVFWYRDFDNQTIDVGTVVTDADGVARFRWRPTGQVGTRVLHASVASARERLRTLFVVHVNPGAPSRIEVLDAMQEGYVGATVRSPLFRVTDAFGNGVGGVRTEFSPGEPEARVSGAVKLSLSNGVVSPSAWTLGPDTGSYTLIASIGTASATARAHAASGAPATISVLSGTIMQLAPGGRVWNVRVRVTDSLGRAVPRAPVSWIPPAGVPGCVSVTDLAGVSALPCEWSMGAIIGDDTLKIAAGVAREAVILRVVAPPAGITFVSPTPNGAHRAGAVLADSVRVAVTAADGAPVPGLVVSVSVEWSLTGAVLVTTDARGIATTAWRMPDDAGPVTLVAAPQGFGGPTASVAIFATGPITLRAIAAGGGFTCGIGAHYPLQSIFCWGRNESGELADGSTVTRRLTPSLSDLGVIYPPEIRAIASGARHGCYVIETSLHVSVESTTCWGAGESGQVAGTLGPRYAPTRVASFLGRVATGAAHSCGIAYDAPKYLPWTYWGTCWGDDSRGALGDGPAVTGGRTRVVFPADAPQIRRIAAGDGFSCATMADGRAWCWGRNDRGQLGDGTTVDRHAPVPVVGGIAFDSSASIAAGAAHACARRTDGSVFCWGANDRGQLGDGTTADRHVPTRAIGEVPFQWIAAGGAHTCGLTSGGAAYCWGANDAGQLGTGTFGGSVVAAQRVAASMSLQKLTTGRDHTCALSVVGTGTGSPYCWGLNADGQLGDGTTTNRSMPTAVADFHP